MTYQYVLIPGRHHTLTRFQVDHLRTLLRRDDMADTAMVIWAITSASHSGTQRNPIAGERRLGMIEAVMAEANIPAQTYGITNMATKPEFAHYVIESIRIDSKGRVDMHPDNTLIVCSTKSVAEQYAALGFTIDTAESDTSFSTYLHATPWDAVELLIASGSDWRDNKTLRSLLHPASYEYIVRYGLGDDIVEVFQDPLIESDDGDITTTRDYETYRQAFEDGAKRKVSEFEQYVQPGRILDVGCATGETLKLLTQRPELFESDFYGIEAARPLYQISQQRKDRGEFGTQNIFFYQRNIMRSSLFPRNSLSTVITMALTHEVESYLGRHELQAFIRRMYDIIMPGGVYINYDVVAPDEKDTIVYVRFTEDDGVYPEDLFPGGDDLDQAAFLRALSTKARFVRFAHDFRMAEGDGMTFHWEDVDGDNYAVMRYADLCDFLAKKDYIDSWTSEMHERFCFWEYSDWVTELEAAGFVLQEGSEKKQNPWLIEHRFAPAATVYRKTDGGLEALPQPMTNALLVARKPE